MEKHLSISIEIILVYDFYQKILLYKWLYSLHPTKVKSAYETNKHVFE